MADVEHRKMEATLTVMKGRTIQRSGKKAILHLPPQDPKPKLSLGMTVNIVVKFLDPMKFPVQSRYTTQMLKDLY